MNELTAVELVKVIERLATAVEQAVLAALDKTNGDPYPASLPIPQEPGYAPLPPMHAPAVPSAPGVCPVHMVLWKTVPAGISKKTGNPYTAFMACPTTGCTQRPAQ